MTDAATPLERVDWTAVADGLLVSGWARIRPAVDRQTIEALADAACGTWAPKDVDAGVRYHHLSCGVYFDGAPDIVRRLGIAISDGVDAGTPPGTPPVPLFNEVTWSRDDDGVMFISPHRDPSGAGGLIAVVNLDGAARFRVWDGDRCTEWMTEDGDLVLLRGTGWPHRTSRCPIHEAQSPVAGRRMTLTMRYNRSGAGGDFRRPRGHLSSRP